MFTASVLIDQQLVRREFSDLVLAIQFVRFVTGEELPIARVHGDVMCGAGLCMHVAGAFVTIARLH
jgi:hypothetical protein